MALDARRRQRKAEKRKAKEKAKRKELAHRKTESLGQRLARVSKAPVLHCLALKGLTQKGMGPVLVSRELTSSQVAYAVFLVDSFCLGVKNAFCGFRPKSEYFERVYEPLAEQHVLEPLEPATACRLVEGAVEYARNVGLSPHADYADARHIFGGIDPRASDRQFEFGKDGKPFFISGPHDTRGRIASVIGILTERLGLGGFEYLISVDGDQLPAGATIVHDFADNESGFAADEEDDESDADLIEDSVVSSVAASSQTDQ